MSKKMKKVYGSPVLAALGSLFCGGYIYLDIYHPIRSPNLFLLICVILAFLKVVSSMFLPSFTYGEDGFEKVGILQNKFYRWSDVKNISYSKVMDQIWIRTDDNNGFTLGDNYSKNFSEVLPEVINFLKNSKSGIEIPADLTKRIKGFDSSSSRGAWVVLVACGLTFLLTVFFMTTELTDRSNPAFWVTSVILGQ